MVIAPKPALRDRLMRFYRLPYRRRAAPATQCKITGWGAGCVPLCLGAVDAQFAGGGSYCGWHFLQRIALCKNFDMN